MDRVRVKLPTAGFLLFVGTLLWQSSASAEKMPIYQDDSCRRQTSLHERTQQLPNHLLTAISLAETGRWDADRRVMFAWPWTVTASGKGRYFKTKADAIREVKKLQATGLKSIDVGCMQINLFYHPRAFKSLDDAFNPELNVGYASHFLKSLYRETQSWQQAAAHYHSTDPRVNEKYKNKVIKLWSGVGGNVATLKLDRPVQTNLTDAVQRVRAQRDLLNARFRARLNAERSLRKPEKRRSHLDAWRAAAGRPTVLSQFAARQRADRERVQRITINPGRKSFETKRRNQLTAWRTKQAQRIRERIRAQQSPQPIRQ